MMGVHNSHFDALRVRDGGVGDDGGSRFLFSLIMLFYLRRDVASAITTLLRLLSL